MEVRKIDRMEVRKVVAECIGTALLVFFAVGTATLSFGFQLFGTSPAAGVVATALAFGLVLLGLVYTIGPISGCHVNPAVTLGFIVARRMSIKEAVGYWIAQLVGGVIGALLLWAVFSGSEFYSRANIGMGATGYGVHSIIGLGIGTAFLAELILTFLFVLVVLSATSRVASAGFAGLAIGSTLVVVHLIGIALTGTSVNPARSFGPAVVLGGDAMRQVWMFFVGPLAGGAIAAVVWRYVFAPPPVSAAGRVEPTEVPSEAPGQPRPVRIEPAPSPT